MISSPVHILQVKVPDLDPKTGKMGSSVTEVRILLPEDFEQLHRAIITKGRCGMSDTGNAEDGPCYHYGGHEWGGMLAFSDDKTMINCRNRGVYTTARHLPKVIDCLLAIF